MKKLTGPLLLAGWALSVAVRPVMAGPAEVSQYVGMTNGVLDEFGAPLQGTDPQAGDYGITAVDGDLVQIYHALDNSIYAPDTNGTAHANNDLLTTTRIGRGLSPTLAIPARFSTALTPRPGGNSRIFARAFNAPSVAEASFYTDSQIYKIISFKMETFIPQFAKTDTPLDANDSDGDGLNNSWEKSYGSDPDKRDTDDDGLNDAEEALSATDLLDPESVLVIVNVLPGDGEDALLRWDSVAGKNYRVEYSADPLNENPVYQTVSSLVATGSVSEVSVPDGLADDARSYRVMVFQSP